MVTELVENSNSFILIVLSGQWFVVLCRRQKFWLQTLLFLSDGWSRTSHPCTKNEFGVWELTLPYKEDGSSPIPHGSKVKVGTFVWITNSHASIINCDQNKYKITVTLICLFTGCSSAREWWFSWSYFSMDSLFSLPRQ